jgi:hypothetical protein
MKASTSALALIVVTGCALDAPDDDATDIAEQASTCDPSNPPPNRRVGYFYGLSQTWTIAPTGTAYGNSCSPYDVAEIDNTAGFSFPVRIGATTVGACDQNHSALVVEGYHDAAVGTDAFGRKITIAAGYDLLSSQVVFGHLVNAGENVICSVGATFTVPARNAIIGYEYSHVRVSSGAWAPSGLPETLSWSINR